MNSLFWCAVLLLSISLVQSKKICPTDDLDCITRGARNVYNALLKGGDGIQGIEALVLDNVDVKIPGFKYVLTNATLSPMKNCQVTMRSWSVTAYEYVLQCSQLSLSAKVVAKGRLGSIDVDGSDFVTITATDYTIVTKGQQNIVDTKDGHSKKFVLLNTNFAVDTECHGTITFKSNNQFGLTKAQAELVQEHFTNNTNDLENTFGNPVIKEFMKNLILNKIAAYVDNFTVEQIIPKEA